MSEFYFETSKMRIRMTLKSFSDPVVVIISRFKEVVKCLNSIIEDEEISINTERINSFYQIINNDT